jgi:hypothetical protein
MIDDIKPTRLGRIVGDVIVMMLFTFMIVSPFIVLFTQDNNSNLELENVMYNEENDTFATKSVVE